MKRLPDKVVNRLREAAAAPDLSGTRYRLLGKSREAEWAQFILLRMPSSAAAWR